MPTIPRQDLAIVIQGQGGSHRHLKYQGPEVVPADVVVKFFLPSGVMLKVARQKRARRHATGNSLEQRGSNLYFLGILDPSVTAIHVAIKVLMVACPPAALSFGIATYVDLCLAAGPAGLVRGPRWRVKPAPLSASLATSRRCLWFGGPGT